MILKNLFEYNYGAGQSNCSHINILYVSSSSKRHQWDLGINIKWETELVENEGKKKYCYESNIADKNTQ